MNRAQLATHKQALAIGEAGDPQRAASMLCKIYRDGNDATKRQIERTISTYPRIRERVYGTCNTGYSAVAPRKLVYTTEARYVNPDKSAGAHIQRWECVTVYEDDDLYEFVAVRMLEETGRPQHFPARDFTKCVCVKRFQQPRVQFL